MGLFSRLFGKKKVARSQEDYLIEPVPKKSEEVAVSEASLPEAEPIPAEPKEVKEAPEKKPPATKKTTVKAEPAKKAASTAKKPSAPIEKAEEPKPAPKENTKNGFFEIKKSKDSRYVFNLYASNKVIIATSQIYSSASAAINGIKSVKANAEIAGIEDQTLKSYTTLPFPKWEIYQDKGGDYRFRLSASNGSCVCHSQGYTSKANCKNGIQSIIRTAKNAEIDKAYLIK